MGNFTKICCSLCLNYIDNKRFRVIDETINEILDILFLKLVKEETKKSLICETCRTKLFQTFRFKATCMEMEDSIISQGNSENGELVDLRDIYREKRGKEHFRVILEDDQICRLCVQIATSEFTPMEDVDIELTHKYIPEVNFKLTKDPVICSACLDSLETHRTFIKDCFEADKETNNIRKDVAKEEQLYIKHEDIEIKSEENEEASYSPLQNDVPTTTETTDMASRESPHSNHDPCPEAQIRGSSSKNSKRKKLSKDATYKCIPCKYETKHRKYLNRHQRKHKAHMYKCDTCNYETKYKGSLAAHQLVHKDTSEVMYKCHNCHFGTRYKRSLTQHQLKHKNSSRVQMYKCNMCDYATKYKYILVQHQLKHKKMYICGTCNYESRYKTHLTRHLLIHKDVSEVQMYKCGTCSYESKYKANLRRHLLNHKDVSEVQMYKCEICNYETKHKRVLVAHTLKHRDISEVRMHKCDECSFRTKYRKSLVKHQLIHKDVSEVQMYKCDSCSFQTKHKAYLGRHQLKHKNV